MTDEMTHWWAGDARYTLCDKHTVGAVLSTTPSCPICVERMAINAAYVAALETKTPRDYRIDLAASALAPTLRQYCLIVDEQPVTPFDELPSEHRDHWLKWAAGVLEVLTAKPPVDSTTTLVEYAEKWQQTALRLVKGNK